MPCLVLVTWRGFEGKDAPEHLVMGDVLPRLLDGHDTCAVDLAQPRPGQVDQRPAPRRELIGRDPEREVAVVARREDDAGLDAGSAT